MQDSFAWFRTRSRFDTNLTLYRDMSLDKHVAPTPGSAVRAISLSRHELVFETGAIGSPHLIKLAYHPRWQLRSKGQLALAGPGYMLVVPQEKEIRLVYGHTLIGKLGIATTVLSALAALFALCSTRRETSPAAVEKPALRPWIPALLGWAALLAAGFYFAGRSPERLYNLAWQHMRANRYAEASEGFKRAYELRRPPAKKEEALFWLAKASELAGRRAQAKARYRELADHFYGYWLPESLYTYVLLEEQDGRADLAAQFALRLRQEYPGNKWTLKLDEAK
jgi:tetratricopeptide (TPR) repeat protein